MAGGFGASFVTYTGTHLTERVEDSVQDDEQGKDFLQRVDCSTNDESHDGPENKAQGHGLFTANLVHEDTAKKAAGEIETVQNRSITNSLREGVVGVKCREDGRPKNSKGICLHFISMSLLPPKKMKMQLHTTKSYMNQAIEVPIIGFQ